VSTPAEQEALALLRRFVDCVQSDARENAWNLAQGYPPSGKGCCLCCGKPLYAPSAGEKLYLCGEPPDYCWHKRALVLLGMIDANGHETPEERWGGNGYSEITTALKNEIERLRGLHQQHVHEIDKLKAEIAARAT
jgi:hypothetical protein